MLTLITSDIQHIMDFYKEISKKCSEVQKLELEKNPDNSFIQKFLTILNDEFETTE